MLKSIAPILVASALTSCAPQRQVNIVNRSPSVVQVSNVESAGAASRGIMVRPGQTGKLSLSLRGGRPKISFRADGKGYVFQEVVPRRDGAGEIVWLGKGRLALRTWT